MISMYDLQTNYNRDPCFRLNILYAKPIFLPAFCKVVEKEAA